MTIRNFVPWAATAIILIISVTGAVYGSDLVDLTQGEPQIMTMPVVCEGQQYLFSFKYKYTPGETNPVFRGPILFEYDRAAADFKTLTEDDPRAQPIILQVQALMEQLVMAGKERFSQNSAGSTDETNQDTPDNTASEVSLLGIASSSINTRNNSTTSGNTPVSNGSLVGGTNETKAQVLPDGQPIFKRTSTTMAFNNGTITRDDLKPEDYVALSHKVIENEDGSRTVTVVLPAGSRENAVSLTQRLALTPHMFITNGKIVASGNVRMNFGGLNTVTIDPATGNKTVTKTYFVSH